MKPINEIWKNHLSIQRTKSFITQYKMNPSDFTRNRGFSFSDIIGYLATRAKKSLKIECHKLSEITSKMIYSKQSLSQARKKINPQVFRDLHRDLVQSYYKDNNRDLWRGFRVFGGDGSTLQLPKQEDIPMVFGDQYKYLSLARVFQYSDVMTDTVVSAQIAPISTGEKTLAYESFIDLSSQMNCLGQTKQLYIYDRGLPSHRFAQMHIEQSSDFIFRVPKHFLPQVRETLFHNQTTDILVEIKRGKICYKARIIVEYLSSGQPLILLTSLTDRGKFSTQDIVEGYALRWRCEESYKFQKLTLQLENFSGKTFLTVLQDYWSTVYVAAVLSLMFVENKPKDSEYHINKSVVFSLIKDDFLKATLGFLGPDDVLDKLRQLCSKYQEPIRPGRSYPRTAADTRKRRHIYRKTC